MSNKRNKRNRIFSASLSLTLNHYSLSCAMISFVYFLPHFSLHYHHHHHLSYTHTLGRTYSIFVTLPNNNTYNRNHWAIQAKCARNSRTFIRTFGNLANDAAASASAAFSSRICLLFGAEQLTDTCVHRYFFFVLKNNAICWLSVMEGGEGDCFDCCRVRNFVQVVWCRDNNMVLVPTNFRAKSGEIFSSGIPLALCLFSSSSSAVASSNACEVRQPDRHGNIIMDMLPDNAKK